MKSDHCKKKMASHPKKSWKLQEFTAHNANVNCLALGHKSGRVLATGGDDKKVNLWAVGKPKCIMSLGGHVTPIESVCFNTTEELMCAGSQTGALKLWDLEAAKLVKSMIGHKAGITCLDFHPYGDFIASGSNDNTIKLWDPRKKTYIHSFSGHKSKTNDIKFSPDGHWVASTGEDSIIKLWDLRVGRSIHEFTEHTNSVTSLEFHPHDFLLASGGLDKTVFFYDLENFHLLSMEKDVGAVKCLWFHPEGQCLFTGVTDNLKVVGWDSPQLYDTVPIGWGKISDIATAQNQIVGASFHLTNVTVYIVDIKRIKPFCDRIATGSTNPFSPGQSIRKSFSKERPMSLRSKTSSDIKTIEESTSGTDPEEDISAEISNIDDYSEIFQPNQSLRRTPPLLIQPFKEPESDADPSEPQILCASEDEPTFTLSQLTITENRSPPRIRYSPPQIKKSPSPEPLNSPPYSLNSEPERLSSSTLYPRSQSNLEQIFNNKISKIDSSSIVNSSNRLKSQQAIKYELQRQYSNKEVAEKLSNNINNNGIKHSASEANISVTPIRSRKNSFVNAKSNRNSSIPNLSRISNATINKNNDDHNYRRTDFIKPQKDTSYEPMFKKPDPPKPLIRDEYGFKRSESAEESPDAPPPTSSSRTPLNFDSSAFVPTPLDRPLGLDLEEFLPTNLRSPGYTSRIQEESEEDLMNCVSKDHNSTITVLLARLRSLKVCFEYFKTSTDTKTAVERVINMKDVATSQDILHVLTNRTSFWSLDTAVLILPTLHQLIQSRFEYHMKTGCEALRQILRNFSSLIRTNMLAPCSGYSVDIPREERYQKCRKCYDVLMDIRNTLFSKQHIPGDIGSSFKEIYADLNQLCIDNH